MRRKLPRLPGIPWRGPRADVDDELRFHIDMAAADLVAQGLAPDVARAEAERRFGALTDIRDACLTIDERRRRSSAATDRMSYFLQDLRDATRSLARTPMLTIAGTLTLMLGVGATTAIFSVVNGVLLRPLPYANADRLVAVGDDRDGTPSSMSYPDFADWQKEGTEVFESLGAWFSTSLTLTGMGDPVVLRGQRMSASVPGLLGVRPVIGRSFLPEDDGVSAGRVVMLSSETWRRRFNADTGIVGRTLQLSGFPFTVIGVYPSGPTSRLPNELTNASYSDFWQSFRLTPTAAPRSLHFMSAMGRLRPGTTPDVMRARMDHVNDRLTRDSVTTQRLAAADLTTHVIGDTRKLLGFIFVAVVLVLLVACANVANLLLARATSRQREIAVRTALGAGRGRIVSQLLTESLLRALLGGLLGVAVAYAALRVFQESLSVRIPRFADVTIDPMVLAFSIALSLLTGLAFGFVPAMRSAKADPNAVMREGGRGVAGSLRRDAFRRSLIVGELVMSFVLLAGAGLLVRSFERLLSVPRGFQSERIVTASVNLPSSRYPDSVRSGAFFNDLLERVRAVPGVVSAGMSSDLPVQGGSNGGVTVEGRNYPTDKLPIADKRWASPGYFQTIGARFVAGRDFIDADAMDRPHVLIVNEAFANELFPGESAIGKRVGFEWNTTGYQTIVGVIANVKEQALNSAVRPAVYMPMDQRATWYMYLVVRTSVDELSIVPSLRRELAALDPMLPLDRVKSLDDVISDGVAGPRLATSLMSSFSLVALMLAAIGLYGVISYSVAQRTQELGIRAALGAQRREILGGVMREGMMFVVAGVIIGALAARGAAQFIASQLFGVSPGDPIVYLGVAAVLVAVSAAALIFPALRASRIDPVIALREE